MITYKMKTVMTFCFMFILRPGFAKIYLELAEQELSEFYLVGQCIQSKPMYILGYIYNRLYIYIISKPYTDVYTLLEFLDLLDDIRHGFRQGRGRQVQQWHF